MMHTLSDKIFIIIIIIIIINIIITPPNRHVVQLEGRKNQNQYINLY
jgi:hypothetical protein